MNGRARGAVVGVALFGMVALGAPAHAQYTAKLALIAQTGQPIELGAQKFKELVEQNSKGQIKVQIFPGGQLGGEIELQDSVANGTLQFASIGTPVTAGKLKKLDILNMYYLWKDREHMRKVLQGTIGKELFAEYEKVTGNRVVASNWQQGTRETLVKKKVVAPADFKGVKIRVTAGVPLYDQLWTAMGASPVPLPFPEAYSAMQTGVVDAVELPPDFILNNGFNKLGKYLALTDHYFYTNIVIANGKFYSSLPKELQAVVDDAALKAGDYQTAIVLKQQDELIQKIKASGVEIVPTDKAAFAAAVRPVFEKNMNVWGADLYQKIMKAAD